MTDYVSVMEPLREFRRLAGWPRGRVTMTFSLNPPPEFKSWLAQRLAGDPLTVDECKSLPDRHQVLLNMLIGHHYHQLLEGLVDPTPYLQDTSEYEIGTPFLRYLQQAGWVN